MNCWSCGADELIQKSDGNIYCCECGTILYEGIPKQRWYDKLMVKVKHILSRKK